ncbi:Uncharacterised protein [Vibrio cholerae]|uniref:Uncharacterized protein n=1 Tax=Vibrio cholerae TaxID=666 RepID=A0A655RUG8_VIBCL|nr:Uncharacterised protein [Vibrio cholerae]
MVHQFTAFLKPRLSAKYRRISSLIINTTWAKAMMLSKDMRNVLGRHDFFCGRLAYTCMATPLRFQRRIHIS